MGRAGEPHTVTEQITFRRYATVTVITREEAARKVKQEAQHELITGRYTPFRPQLESSPLIRTSSFCRTEISSFLSSSRPPRPKAKTDPVSVLLCYFLIQNYGQSPEID